MTRTEFRSLDVNVHNVICPKRIPDMPQGWADGMDDMVGVQLQIEDVNTDSGDVAIRHQKSNITYRFDYTVLVRVLKRDNSSSTFTIGNNKYSVANVLLTAIKSKALRNDYIELTKIINSDNLKITKNTYVSIKSKCPRIIGVLLSSNILKVENNPDNNLQ